MLLLGSEHTVVYLSENVGETIKRYFICSDMPEPLIVHNLKLAFSATEVLCGVVCLPASM